MLNNKLVSRLVEAEKDARVINAAFDLEKGKCSFALAVVTETWGSSPRQAGSMMLVEKGGHVVGSVSGGCVEGEVVTYAKEIMDLEKFQVLNFGIADDDAWKAGLSCGGKMTVFVCPNNFVQKGLFGKIKESDNGGENITIECDLKNGLIRQVNELSEEIMDNFTVLPKLIDAMLKDKAESFDPYRNLAQCIIDEEYKHLTPEEREPDCYADIEFEDALTITKCWGFDVGSSTIIEDKEPPLVCAVMNAYLNTFLSMD